MKKINIIYIVVFIGIILISVAYIYKTFEHEYLMNQKYLEFIKQCDNGERDEEFCSYIKPFDSEISYPTQFMFYEIIMDSPIDFLNVISALLVSAMAIYSVSKIFNSGIVKYILSREDYFIYIRKLIFSCLKYALYYTLIFFIVYLICAIACKWNFDISTIGEDVSFFDLRLINLGPVLFIVFWLFNLFVMSIIYILCSIIAIRIINNYYASVILSYFIFLTLLIISHILVGSCFFYILLNINTYAYFNLLNVFSLSEIPNYYIYFLIRLIIIFILSLIIYLLYRNKEKFIIFVENRSGCGK